MNSMLTAGWPADMLTESARAKTPPEHFFTLCAPLYTEHVWQNITVLQYDNMVNWFNGYCKDQTSKVLHSHRLREDLESWPERTQC